MTWDGSAGLRGHVQFKKKYTCTCTKHTPSTAQMNALLPRILPSVDFSEERERVRARLEHVLLMQLPETMFPRGSALRVFGSSSNGFGNDSSDLDM